MAALRANGTAGADMRDPAKDNVTVGTGASANVITLAANADGYGVDTSLAVTVTAVPAAFGLRALTMLHQA